MVKGLSTVDYACLLNYNRDHSLVFVLCLHFLSLFVFVIKKPVWFICYIISRRWCLNVAPFVVTFFFPHILGEGYFCKKKKKKKRNIKSSC